VLKKRRDYSELMQWSFEFSERCGFLDNVTRMAIDLASQELGWKPRRDEFTNPYRQEPVVDDRTTHAKVKDKSKHKNKWSKGPTMSQNRVEL
jgi:hypothetical protein